MKEILEATRPAGAMDPRAGRSRHIDFLVK